MRHAFLPAFTLCCLTLSTPACAQSTKGEQPPSEPLTNAIDGEHWFGSLEYRNIGPSRGGRVSTVAGVRGDRNTYYMGATGGGVWKTEDAGASWSNITDGQVQTGSVGAIAVAESDPNVIYVGMGEPDPRGNFSHGDGVYKSTDAGKNWTHVGLADTRQIGRIAVHPANPDLVYVAALGHVYGSNSERGVFRSTDGGDTWQHVLHVNDETGAVDISMDPFNPRVLYAGFWQMHRTPWSMSSGGEGSGLYRSTDGGDTWTELTEGLPEGVKGKIGVSASAAQRDLVYAIIEAQDGGVFRSTDGGETWTKTNEQRDLRQRAWYYSRIHADTQEPDTVYVLNVQFHKSVDGGTSFETIRVPHVDNHGMWIDPDDNQRMVQSNDGGANVSFNGGATWSTQDNQPTAQFYHVTVDNQYPYRIYGAQQDNSTISISSRNRMGSWRNDWYAVGGGESGYISVRPDNPNTVYAGSYSGYLTRYDHSTRKTRTIMPWPENPIGGGIEDWRHRWQWTFPIHVSLHDNDVLYTCSQHVLKTRDGGETWDIISPDLTTNDKSKQASSGGPITQDNTGVEYYCTVFAFAESPLNPEILWAGSDDGLVHVTSDGGATWNNVTPPGMGEALVSIIDASRHDENTAYLAVNKYKQNDFTPYIYRTRDRGQSWDLIVEGIAEDAFVRAVRADHQRPGLLYAGTETGMWISFDDGDSWQSFQLELPVVPITDLVVHGNDLVLATQGRSFWTLTGLDLVRQLAADSDASKSHLFEPSAAVRAGESVLMHVNLPGELEEPALLEVLDPAGEAIRSWNITMKPAETKDEAEEATEEAASEEPQEEEPAAEDTTTEADDEAEAFEAEPGMNVLTWNLRRRAPAVVPGVSGWPGTVRGPRVVPGEFTVRLTVGDETIESTATVRPDPRVDVSAEAFAELDAFLQTIAGHVDRAHKSVNTIRQIKAQIQTAMTRAADAGLDDQLKEASESLISDLTAIEETIIQTKSVSPQDPLGYPVRLNDKLKMLMLLADGDGAPNQGMRDVLAHLEPQLLEQFAAFEALKAERIPAFNALVAEAQVPAVTVSKE